MRVEYINHSGYVVETECAIYIFDYVEGVLPSRYLRSEKPTFFLVSHHHADHYSPAIYRFNKTIILSSDIEVAPYNNVFMMSEGDMIHLGFAKIYAFGSTDAGISFVVEEENVKIFFAGDLNDWHWKEDSSIKEANEATHAFRQALKGVTQHAPFDVVIFPVDARLGLDYDQGAKYAIEQLKPRYFFAMHFWDRSQIQSFIDLSLSLKKPQCFFPRHNNKVFEVVI